ncbi:hypothetical protein KEJ34_03475, partial [Candidatus Bathyarchaeota archaeon]|nr:hypothetical protein [Candidatus Bathyarchaeota archaeon]
DKAERQLPAFYELNRPMPLKEVFNIFVFHMALEIPELANVYPKIAAEAPPSLIPDGFNYYAGGHVHASIQAPFRGGTLVYSGPTETVSYEDAYVEKGFNYVEVDQNGDVKISRIKLESPRKFKVVDRDFSGLTPQEISDLAVKLIGEADEEGAVIVPVLRGILPAESSRREIDLARIRDSAKRALTVHPVVLLREMDLPEETVKSIFSGEMEDLKRKSYEYFLQFFSHRYSQEEAERKAQIALDIMQFLVRGDEGMVKTILEGL